MTILDTVYDSIYISSASCYTVQIAIYTTSYNLKSNLQFFILYN